VTVEIWKACVGKELGEEDFKERQKGQKKKTATGDIVKEGGGGNL